MPLRDLLWACPRCGSRERLRARKGTVRCDACASTFRRGEGATILERRRDGTEHRRSAAALLDELAALDPDALEPPIPARALFAESAPPLPIRHSGRLQGWAERFTTPRPGILRLEEERLAFSGDDGVLTILPLLELTSLQPSSRSLQIKPAYRPVVTFKLCDGSVYDWERRIQAAVRRLYRAHGLGNVAEFQPRVVCR